MIWLHQHLSQIDTAVAQACGPQPVYTGFIAITQAVLDKLPQRAGPETGHRFEIDLLPFVRPDLRRWSSILRLQPDLIATLRACALDDAAEKELDVHLAKTGFTCIDCPTGCVPVGHAFEVKAIFIRSGTIFRKDGRAVPVPLDDGFRFDAILGRPGQLSRQRLSWQLPTRTVTQADVPLDPAYPGERLKPRAMLQQARVAAKDLMADLMQVGLAAILHAQRHEGTHRVAALPRIDAGNVAAHDCAADRDRPSLTIFQLS